jgi:predicted metalloprotease with PDZ domain
VIRSVRFLALLPLAALPAAAQTPAACPSAALRYDIVFQPGAVQVGVCLPGTDADSAAFELGEWAGVRTFGDNVAEIAAADAAGNALPVVRRETGRWVVQAGARRPFRLAYTILYAKPSFMGTDEGGQFQPTLFDTWAFLWGQAYVVRPASDALAALPVRVAVDAGPYRTAHASWGADTVLADVDALRNTALAAGDFRRQVRDVQGVPITFLAQGAWPFADDAFADAVQRVLGVQVATIGSYPTDRLTVILLPGLPNSAGGTVVKDAVVVYPRPEVDVPHDAWALGLIGHEHFHLWTGEVAYPAEDVPEGEVKWFSEGFTDYYADLTLLRAGVLDEAGLVARINDRIRDYLANPHARTATTAVLAERYWASQDYNRLPYVKGALVALLMDLRIRHASGGARSLDDFMRAVFANGAPYRPADLQRMLEETTGMDWDGFMDAYVYGAGELPVLGVCAEVGMECAPGTAELYQRGFRVEGPLQPGAAVTAVDSGSAAERAGIRTSDVLRQVSIQRDTVFAARLEVERAGERVTISYRPTREIPVPRIHPAPASLRVIGSLRGEPAPRP